MKSLQTIALVLFILLAQSVVGPVFRAGAVEWEIGAGQTRSSEAPDSQYVQKTFPHARDLIGAAYYIGVTEAFSHSPQWFNFWSNGVRYRLGWLDLGNVRTEAWATSDDANYSGVGGGCYDMSRCRPEDLSKWDVFMRTKGVEVSAAPEWSVGPGQFFVKAGVLFHRPRINVRIFRLDNDINRTKYDYQERVNAGLTLGLGYTFNDLAGMKAATLSASFYKINAGSNGPDDPTNDINPANIPQPTDSSLGGTVVVLLTGRF